MISQARKKIIISSFIPVLLFSGLLLNSKKAEAQPAVPVNDALLNATALSNLIVNEQTSIAVSAQAIKEVGQVPGLSPIVNQGTGVGLAFTSLDFAANAIAKTIVRRITDSIVGWIDSGFQGQPAFIGNPGGFLLDVADSVAGEFIEGGDLGFLCEPFQLEIKFALDYQYRSTFEDVTCRLSDVLNNVQNFANFTEGKNFARGGWDGWFQVIQPQNNPYGAYIEAESELNVRIAGRQSIELLQLDWGSGFLSFQECLEPAGAPLSECVVKGPIKTPGTVIASGLDQTLGTELSELGLADSFDRILAALLNQLVSRALSSSGLAGISNDNNDDDREFPPLPPENLAATPITSFQIRVTWSASPTEDVEGYYIYRDGQRVATQRGRSNTSFLDSGLQPSTEYSYRISSFIETDNESYRIGPIATTTLPLP